MKVLVTGGSGLIGRYVVDALAGAHDVTVLDLRYPHRALPFIRADVLAYGALPSAVRGFDAVVHLAGIPHPLNDPGERVYGVNALGTYHLLQACAEEGIGSFVLMSSESTLGFAFAPREMQPLFLPIDETHPLRPQDPYGMSKITAEMLCASFTRRTGMRTIALRPPWVWVPEEKEIAFYRQLVAEYPRWYKNLWAYIHVLDLADAVRRVLESSALPEHNSFFVCSDENWALQPARALAAHHYPLASIVPGALEGTASLISAAKAKAAFGFSPEHTWRDLFPPPGEPR